MPSSTKLARKHPLLPRISPEMRQVSDFLLNELLSWPKVTSKPMFGMTALYRGRKIFAVLPRTRAIGSARSVSFKISKKTPAIEKALAAESRIVPTDRKEPTWISFEVESERDIAGALKWFQEAYEQADRKDD